MERASRNNYQVSWNFFSGVVTACVSLSIDWVQVHPTHMEAADMITIPIAKLDNIDSRQPIFLCNEILEKRMDRSFYYIRKRNA
jgi:hypothetical protein